MDDEGRAKKVWGAFERRMESYTLFGARRIVDEAVLRFVSNALFPRLCARMRWSSRLGPRGAVAYVTWRVAVPLLLQGPLRSWAKRRAAKLDALREELGRDPTPEEIAERFGWAPPPAPR